jgi:hypothetical protein
MQIISEPLSTTEKVSYEPTEHLLHLFVCVCVFSCGLGQYDIKSNLFAWIGGSNQFGASFSYPPGGLGGGVVSAARPVYLHPAWTDPSGGLYFGFGSIGYVGGNNFCNGTCAAVLVSDVGGKGWPIMCITTPLHCVLLSLL